MKYCPTCNLFQPRIDNDVCEVCRNPVVNVRSTDNVNHPQHYTHASGVECIDVVEHMSFCLGNAIKYIWRYDRKNGVEDLRKAVWYINREIQRLEKGGQS